MAEEAQRGGGRGGLGARRLGRWVVLVGLMGAGKSSVGRALAERLRAPYADSDQAIEAAAAMPIPEIFARDGEGFFRAREAEVIARLLNGAPGVLSTGGGAWLSEATRRAVAARGVSVWLDADLDTLWARVGGRGRRPLLRTEDPRATLARLLAERAPVYALADLRVRCAPGQGVAETAEAVLTALHARAGAAPA